MEVIREQGIGNWETLNFLDIHHSSYGSSISRYNQTTLVLFSPKISEFIVRSKAQFSHCIWL